jgi:thiol-disulfide isomerase/thioredoxin
MEKKLIGGIKATFSQWLTILLFLSMCAFGLWAQLPRPAADKAENSAKIRKFLAAGKVKEAILFADECLKTGADKEFYLGWKLNLLKMTNQTDRAIECARLLDEAGGEKKVAAATGLAQLYLQTRKPEETLRWMVAAADRGLKDPRLFGDEIWDGVKKDPRYEPILRRIQDNQGIGMLAPEFAVRLIGGRDFSHSQWRGKVVLIDFWATWCPFCIETFPELKKLHQKYNPLGFEILGVSLDQDFKALRKYIQREKLPWPVSFSGREWGEDDTAKLLGVEMIPASFLIDKTGKLRYYNLKKAEFEQAIRTLLDE